MFGARGRSLSAIFATGPIITNDQSGRAAAAFAISCRSMRSSITPQ